MTEVWVCVSWSSDGYHPDAMLDSVHATKDGAVKHANDWGYTHYEERELLGKKYIYMEGVIDEYGEKHWMEITRMEVGE